MQYSTDQKRALTGFFQNGGMAQYASDEIISALCNKGVLGKSTVYRQLRAMTDAGEIRKFHEGKKIYYQYIGRHDACDMHFHLKCASCRKLIHLECDVTDDLREHIENVHAFQIDMRRTVFYGLCEDCRK